MLHALPALLDDIERCLVQGEDPLPLLSATRWADIIEWPRTKRDALALRARLAHLQGLLGALQAPLQVALANANESPAYRANGRVELPGTFSIGLQARI